MLYTTPFSPRSNSNNILHLPLLTNTTRTANTNEPTVASHEENTAHESAAARPTASRDRLTDAQAPLPDSSQHNRSDRGTSDSRRLSRRLPLLSRKSSRAEVAGFIYSPSSSNSNSNPIATSVSAASPALTSPNPRFSTSSTTLGRPTNTELRARDDSADPGLQAVEGVAPRTQKVPNLELLSHNSSTPPQTTGTPRRTSSDAHINSLVDRRGKLARSHSKLENSGQQGRQGSAADKKMHQTSSRLLRMTDDERPYTRDFKDLFSTLMVSLPLGQHRVRFQRIEHTFTIEEAITNLGSLKFSQSNRMPDPKDSTRVVTTTTTTTFSMAKEMARSVLIKFQEARFIAPVDPKADFTSKSTVCFVTPKGIVILERFCNRNGIQQNHVRELIHSARNPKQLVILERERDTDKLNHDLDTLIIIWCRFVGNKANDDGSSDSDSIHEFGRCDTGVKMQRDKRIGDKVYPFVFNGKASVDWLMDCSTMVDKREAYELLNLFMESGFMASAHPAYPSRDDHQQKFVASKSAYYYVTMYGEKVAGWNTSPEGSINGDSNGKAREGAARDSNSNRMAIIIANPAARLLFREFLKDSHCEENLSFYLEVKEFSQSYRAAKKSQPTPKVEVIRETLAGAYSLYNAFLAPGSPNELNIDHSLRTALASRMTRAVGDDAAMMQSLDEVAQLFEKAQNSIFKLMASDSVPKFIKDKKYGAQLRERNLDSTLAGYTSSRSSP